jgi:hypothetical protein
MGERGRTNAALEHTEFKGHDALISDLIIVAFF